MNDKIHMGQLLEKVIRKKSINISELAAALKITRRTLYNWFKQEVIDEVTMQRISGVIVYDFYANTEKPTVIDRTDYRSSEEASTPNGDAYWQNRYIDLLERYSDLVTARRKPGG
ncbi:MAG: helix-turn-helix domain-containing protein [Pedobacter sp.]